MERFSQPESYKEHLIVQSKMWREAAKLHPTGTVRDATIRAARRANTSAHLNEWADSAGLQSPT